MDTRIQGLQGYKDTKIEKKYTINELTAIVRRIMLNVWSRTQHYKL